MRYLPSALSVLGLTGFCLAPPVFAAPLDDVPNQNVFIMGGTFISGYVQDTFAFWDDHYEENYFGGVGYQYFFQNYPEGVRIGAEVGLGLRLGESSSAELWAGLVARYEAFRLGDISISPAITFGLSGTTGTIGVETERAAELGRGVPILYYMGPEISVSHAAHPNLEVLARVQHRSGGFGTIAPIDGSNAAVLGLRYKF
jgi:hypothetical protein